jgi:hypothetical protein
MNCRDARLLLDDLVDGTIAEDSQRALALHLRECAECRTSEARMRALLARVGALPRSIEPARDMWTGIAGRIKAGNVVAGDFAAHDRRWTLVGAAAAAVAALITVTAIVTAVLVRSERLSRVALSPDSGARGAVTASLELSEARGTYDTARRQLRAALATRRGSLSPATLKVIDDNFRVIERAVREIEDALAHDPGNRQLPSLLAAAYRQEIDLLQCATGIPARG